MKLKRSDLTGLKATNFFGSGRCYQTFNLIKAFSVFLAGLIILSLCGCTTNSEPPKLGASSVSASALAQDGTLKVGVNTSLSPMAGTGSSKIIGIDVDIAGAIADELGLELQVVDTGSNPAKALANGDVDVVLGVESADVPANSRLTDQYLSTAVVYFAIAGSNSTVPKVGDGKKIAVQASSKSAWATTNAFGADSVISNDDLSNAFLSLSKGDAQYVAADAVVGLYIANKAGVDVEIVGVDDSVGGYCAAIKADNSEIYSAIQDALSKIKSQGIIKVVEKKWLGKEISLDAIPKVEKASTESKDSENKDNKESDSSKSSNDNSSSSGNATPSGSENSSSSGSTASATDASSVTSSSSAN